MCGITGFTGASDQALLTRMCRRLYHRGPDEEGFYVDEKVSLAMRRLAIIDIQSGSQPICNDDKSVWIVFNGEIYNYQDLRAELIELGHRFKTNSDTEVILHAYLQYGIDFLNRLRGMWGIAIWDINQQRLLLARDRIGEKPLFFSRQHDGNLVFGSEIKALLPALHNLGVDHASVAEYLAAGYVCAPRTFYKNIQKLEPGQYLLWQQGDVHVRRYWQADNENHFEGSYADALASLNSLADESIKYCLKSDVEVGAFLSGGIDSSLITGIMSKYGTKIKTYSVGYGREAEGYNEFAPARTVAQHFGTEHKEIVLDAHSSVDLLPKIIWHYDEPHGEPTSVMVYLMCEQVAKDIKVALGGTGGDELFFGYPKHQGLAMHKLYLMMPKAIREGIIQKSIQNLSESTSGSHLAKRVRRFVDGSSQDLGQTYLNWTNLLDRATREQLLSSNLAEESRPYFGEENLQRFLLGGDDSIFWKVNHLELSGYLPEFQLAYMDRMSMAHSLEVRSPLCDYKMVEFALSLPPKYRVNIRKSKRILRDLSAQYLPKHIVKRPKVGFESPIGQWFKYDLKDFLLSFLAPQQIVETGLLNADTVHGLVNEHLSGKRNHSMALWSIIALEMWHRVYIENGAIDEPLEVRAIRGGQ